MPIGVETVRRFTVKSAVWRAAGLMAQKRFDASLIHAHIFPLDKLQTALRYSREWIEDAIKVVMVNRPA